MTAHANRVAVIYKTVAEEITKEWCEDLYFEHRAVMNYDTRAVYVGTWHKYNDGSIFGMWVDVDTFEDAHEFFKFCYAVHADEQDPELMFQDVQNIPEHFTDIRTDSFFANSFYDFIEKYDEDEQKIITEYWEEVYSEEEPQEIIDKFFGYGSIEEQANEELQMWLSCIQEDKVKDFFENHFDVESLEEEMRRETNETTNYLFRA